MLLWFLVCACRPPAIERTEVVPPPRNVGIGAALPVHPPEPAPPNLLVVLVDDWGAALDRTQSGFGPPMPAVEQLAGEGVSFRWAYGMPNCSPSRSALLTGRLPHDTGVGDALGCLGTRGLSAEEETIAERLRDVGYHTWMNGKWHLSSAHGDLSLADALAPARFGFDEYAGSQLPGCATDGLDSSHYDWERCESAGCERRQDYDAASQFGDAGAAVSTLPEPWFVYLSLYAAHAPFEEPPSPIDAGGDTPAAQLHHQMLADLDERLGHLLDGVDPATTWVFVAGDNGTPSALLPPTWPVERGKGEVYEGGVRIPLYARGPTAAPGSRVDHPVRMTDLFATLAELGGAALPADHPAAPSSHSLLPMLRDPAAPPARGVLEVEMFEGPLEPQLGPRVSRQAVIDPEGWKFVRVDTCATSEETDDPGCDLPLTYTSTRELYRVSADLTTPPPEFPSDDLLSDGVTAAEKARAVALEAQLSWSAWDPQ